MRVWYSPSEPLPELTLRRKYCPRAFSDQWRAVVQVLNLNNQPTRTYFGSDPSQTGTIQYFGRTTYLGVEFKL